MPEESEWTQIWNAREEALCAILGATGGEVFHAVEPFYLGGTADVLPFPNFVSGMTYVTAELTGEDVGQIPSSLDHYELMICTRREWKTAANLISRLARYTCDARLDPGNTMDLRSFFGNSTLSALLFTHPGEDPLYFSFFGEEYGLLLCLGITSDELAFARANGSAALLSLLKEQDVFPYTMPGRHSVRLPDV